MSSAPRILVADDSLTIRKLVESVLRQQGYEVTAVQTGADCISLAPALKPNLILLDYILPDMQGTEICRSLINSPDTWEIPVLLMSSNGNAIRQLFQDFNNVTDYLTKPFAPSVLKAVVGHLLQKGKPNECGESSSNGNPVSSAPAPTPTVPPEFMDKLGRLLQLMENDPQRELSTQKADTAAQPDGVVAGSDRSEAPKPLGKRRRKPITSSPPSESILRAFRLTVQKHLRTRMGQIPDWESLRGVETAEGFYLARLLTKDTLSDLSAELLRVAGVSTDGPDSLRCPASLVPLDAVLRHLYTRRDTGELRIQTSEETILVCLEGGEVVFLTTNHAPRYCVGAACNFQAVPHEVIAEAVRSQEEQSLPFFLTLESNGHLPKGAPLSDLLRVQGEKCLIRAFRATESVISFFPLSKLPATVRASKLQASLDQLLLECYRTVDDWFTLERILPDMDATLMPAHDFSLRSEKLNLTPDELRVIKTVRSQCTIQELADSIQMPPFEVCRILFRFVKLGLIEQGSPRRGNSEAAPAANDTRPRHSSNGDHQTNNAGAVQLGVRGQNEPEATTVQRLTCPVSVTNVEATQIPEPIVALKDTEPVPVAMGDSTSPKHALPDSTSQMNQESEPTKREPAEAEACQTAQHEAVSEMTTQGPAPVDSPIRLESVAPESGPLASQDDVQADLGTTESRALPGDPGTADASPLIDLAIAMDQAIASRKAECNSPSSACCGNNAPTSVAPASDEIPPESHQAAA